GRQRHAVHRQAAAAADHHPVSALPGRHRGRPAAAGADRRAHRPGEDPLPRAGAGHPRLHGAGGRLIGAAPLRLTGCVSPLASGAPLRPRLPSSLVASSSLLSPGGAAPLRLTGCVSPLASGAPLRHRLPSSLVASSSLLSPGGAAPLRLTGLAGGPSSRRCTAGGGTTRWRSRGCRAPGAAARRAPPP